MATIYASTTDKSIINTTTETSLIANEIDIPADFMAVGTTLRLTLIGFTDTKLVGPGTLTLRLRWSNGTFIVLTQDTYTPTPHISGFFVEISYYIACRVAGVSGTFRTQGRALFFTGNTTVDFLELGAPVD